MNVMSVLSREERALFLDLLTRIVEGNQAYQLVRK